MNQNNKIANQKLQQSINSVSQNDTKNNEIQQEENNKTNVLSTVITQDDCINIIKAFDTILKVSDGVDKSIMVTRFVEFLQSKVPQNNIQE